jgi:hypothetical protein
MLVLNEGGDTVYSNDYKPVVGGTLNDIDYKNLIALFSARESPTQH